MDSDILKPQVMRSIERTFTSKFLIPDYLHIIII